MKKLFVLAICILFFTACDHHQRTEKKTTGATDTILKSDTSSAKKEIQSLDKEFTTYSQDNGLAESFEKYLNTNGVLLKTNHMPIISKDSVVAFFKKKKIKDVKFTRTPSLIEISKSNDMAYIYGTYQISGTSSKGNTVSSNGSYVSVWKKNSENIWELSLECENEGLVPVKKQK